MSLKLEVTAKSTNPTDALVELVVMLDELLEDLTTELDEGRLQAPYRDTIHARHGKLTVSILPERIAAHANGIRVGS